MHLAHTKLSLQIQNTELDKHWPKPYINYKIKGF